MEQTQRTLGDLIGSTQSQNLGSNLNPLNEQNYYYMVSTWHSVRYPNGLKNISETEIRNNCREIAGLYLIASEIWQDFGSQISNFSGQQFRQTRQPTRAA